MDPWSWLLAPRGEGWRAVEARGNPAHDPRFVLLRRTLKVPRELFAKLIAGIAGADSESRLRWRHRRRVGDGHDSLVFDAADGDSERCVFAVETLTSEQLALWFFSGFVEPNDLNPGFFEEHETQGRVPRLVLGADHEFPLDRWLREAMQGTLRFSWDTENLIESGSVLKDQSCIAAEVFVDAVEESPEAVLIVCERGAHRVLRLEAGRYALGRDPRCDLVLRDGTVSARQAILEVGAESSLTDLGGRNRCLVNGAVLVAREATALGELAAIRIAGQELLFRAPGLPGRNDEGVLQALSESGAISSTSLDRVLAQAQASELSAGEQLVLEGLLSPEDWARRSGVPGQWQEARSTGPWILAFLAALLLILAAIVLLVGPLVFEP